MEWLLPLAVFVSFSSSIWLMSLAASRMRRQMRLRAWHLAAKRAGLTGVGFEKGGLFRREALLGRSGNLHVRLEMYSSREDESGTKMVVAALGDGAGGLSLCSEGLSIALEKRVGGDREVRIGDPAFDEEYDVRGDAALVLALLDADTRATLAALMRNRVATPEGEFEVWGTSLTDGVLQVRVADGPVFTGKLEQRVPVVVAAVLDVAHRLVAPGDLAARIVLNLRREPVAGVRAQCLATLARRFPGHPATREALLVAREDPDAEVRLRAGIALGSEGRDVLRAVAGGEGATDATTERAVAALEPDLTVEEAMGLLRSALRTRRVATAKACLVAVGRRGGAEAVALLARVLAVESGELAWAAARALAITRDPAAEEPLLRALAEGTRDVRLAAAAALGHVGTAAAVGPLREAEAGDGEMRRAARQAIAEIQACLTGAEPGQLSLTGGKAGALSLAEEAGEPGRLSLAEESQPEERRPGRGKRDRQTNEP